MITLNLLEKLLTYRLLRGIIKNPSRKTTPFVNNSKPRFAAAFSSPVALLRGNKVA